MLKLLQIAVTVALVVTSVTLAPFAAMLGLLGIAGRLSDTSRWENLVLGMQLLGIALLVWGSSLVWYTLCNPQSHRWRFSLRTLLIATTLVAVGLAAIVYVSR